VTEKEEERVVTGESLLSKHSPKEWRARDEESEIKSILKCAVKQLLRYFFESIVYPNVIHMQGQDYISHFKEGKIHAATG